MRDGDLCTLLDPSSRDSYFCTVQVSCLYVVYCANTVELF